ncbi:MAG TPA: SDR family NAD(P)-dependent oxidoreductase, partial [bacterium]|nr:SDR family NAD(P)-dependent oxidoreductase [bacterium]
MRSRWNAQEASALQGLDLLVYVTRCLGAEEDLVLHGGGNTSAKFDETDFLGRPTRVLRIKGSGWDLATIEPAGFAPCRQADLEPLLNLEEELDDSAMVDAVAATLLDPKAPRPSIETLLHAFVPETWILHSHADAILSLANSAGRGRTVREVLGERVVLVPYRRPGHRLSQEVGQAYRAHPGAWGVVLMNHGLVTWGPTAEEAYRRHIELVTGAEEYLAAHGARIAVEPAGPYPDDTREPLADLAPRLRGLLCGQGPCVMRLEQSPLVERFVTHPDLHHFSQRGTATPDHLLFTKRVPLILSESAVTDNHALEEAVRGYADRYAAEYRQHATGEFPMLDPTPRVVLVPSLRALWAVGANIKEAARIADIYRHTMAIILAAEGLGGFRTLDPVDAHHAEYWPLELYKRTLAPKPAELEGRIALVTGAGSGIGRAIAARLAQAGAHAACLDLSAESAAQAADDIAKQRGKGRAVGVACDVADEMAVRRGIEETLLAFGGLDIVVSNAGAIVAGEIVDLSLEEWER